MTKDATSEAGVAGNTSDFHSEIAGSNPAPRSKDRRIGRYSNCKECEIQFASFCKNKMWSQFCSRACKNVWVSKNRKPQIRKGRPGIPGPIPKRNRATCSSCGVGTASHKATLCKKCRSEARQIISKEKTVAEMVAPDYSSRNRYQKIRAAAVRLSKNYEAKCSVCGYLKFVEVAHIKSIASFPADAKMGEVNSPRNLSFLCRNHHWEFDNNSLDGTIKSLAEQTEYQST